MLTYSLNPASKVSLYEQLYRALHTDIVRGVLAGGERLPSKRRLAAHLSISQTTVEAAYDQLVAEGYLYTRPRCGYFVEPRLNGLSSEIPAPTPLQCSKPRPIDQDILDLRMGQVDTTRFPFSTWARLSRTVLSEYADRLLETTDPCGVPQLREQIARYLRAFRGIQVSPDQIIVGAGSEYLTHLLIHLLGKERVYAAESPGYRKLYQIFSVNGAVVRPIPLDEHGLQAEVLARTDASAVYLTPSHHFPLGTVMPVSRRLTLLRWASEMPDRYLIEDDYDSEFRYASRPIPALRTLDRHGRVVYVNTFTRSLAPGLRIGYMVLPDALMARYRQSCSLYASTVPSFEQHTLAAFLQSGGFERHISRSRKTYQLRRDALASGLADALSAVPHSIAGTEAGLHLLLSVQNGMGERTLIERAAAQGVRVYGLSDYYLPPAVPPPATLVLGYAGLDERALHQAAARLGRAWRGE